MDFGRRKELYKKSHEKNQSWKDAYRRKCFDRLRASRSRLIDQFRNVTMDDENTSSSSNMIQDVMEIEWNVLTNNNGFPSLNRNSTNSWSFLNDSFDEKAMQDILAEIENELATEDERLVNELLNHDKEELHAQISLNEANEVFCPVCKVHCLKEVMERTAPAHSCNVVTPVTPKSPLAFERKLRIKCVCGLVLDGKDVTLSMIRTSLQQSISIHGQNCSAPLVFDITQDGRGTNVLVTCTECDWMSFLI